MMAYSWKDLHDRGHVSSVGHLEKPNQLVLVVCTYVGASPQKSCLVLFHLVKRLAVVDESLSLANGAVVVQIDDVADQLVVERFDYDVDTTLLGPSDVLTALL